MFNTLVENQSNVVMLNRHNGLGATQFIFANNIILGGDTAVSINGPLPDATWQGNIVWAAEDEVGDIPSGGYASIDPLLAKRADGSFRLQPGSAAIGRGTGSYPYVDVDIDGHRQGAEPDMALINFRRRRP